MAPMRSLTEVKLPRRMACQVMNEKKTSAMFSHDPDLGVKCKVNRGYLASQARTSGWVWVPWLPQTISSGSRE
jgi:hypothetical protein